MWILVGAFSIRQNLIIHLQKGMLCLIEKYHIIFSTNNLLNKRNELVTKCRYENKLYLPNYKDIPP